LPRQVYLLLIKPAFAGRTLQPFRHLHSCFGCFRLEQFPGGDCTRWKAPPLHGARQEIIVKDAFLASHQIKPAPAAA
jgi:hypothetical protein